MGGIIAAEHISLDGVVEAPGTGRHRRPPAQGLGLRLRSDGRALQARRGAGGGGPPLGNVTYESMAAFWPGFDGPFADKLNAMPKYVLSTTLGRRAGSTDRAMTDESVRRSGRTE